MGKRTATKTIQDKPPEYPGTDDAMRYIFREMWELKQAITQLQGAVQAAKGDPDKPMGIEEAAAYLRISKGYLYILESQGKIPSYKPSGQGGHVYFKREELDDYLFRNKTAADYEVEDKATEIVNQLRR
jgi:excisionase family DNA binding protein